MWPTFQVRRNNYRKVGSVFFFSTDSSKDPIRIRFVGVPVMTPVPPMFEAKATANRKAFLKFNPEGVNPGIFSLSAFLLGETMRKNFSVLLFFCFKKGMVCPPSYSDELFGVAPELARFFRRKSWYQNFFFMFVD